LIFIWSILTFPLLIGDYDWAEGRVSGAIYRNNSELTQLIGNIYAIASYSNPLHPDIFPGICKMEAEVVRIVCHLFNGDKASCGTASSSSIIFTVYIKSHK